MRSEFHWIISALEISHPEAIALREETITFCKDKKSADQLLKKLELDDNSFGNIQEYRALSALSKACAYDVTSDEKSTLNDAFTALEQFRYYGNDFNEALVYWFFAAVYRNQGKNNLAIVEYDNALKKLVDSAYSAELESDYIKKIKCERQIRECTKHLRMAKKAIKFIDQEKPIYFRLLHKR